MLGIGLGIGLPALTARRPAPLAAYDPVSDLGADLLGYWEANRSDLITRDGSNRVSSWKDIVAAYDQVQATDANKPVYGATIFAGAPGIAFDGIDDCLTLASQPFPAGAANGSEIWVLVDQTLDGATTPLRAAFAYGTITGQERYVGRVPFTGVNRARIVAGNGTGSIGPSGTVVDLSGRHVIRGVFTSAAVALYANGIAEGSVTGLGGTEATRCRIGARGTTSPANFWGGSIAAILVTRPLADARANRLLGFLSRRRG